MEERSWGVRRANNVRKTLNRYNKPCMPPPRSCDEAQFHLGRDVVKSQALRPWACSAAHSRLGQISECPRVQG